MPNSIENTAKTYKKTTAYLNKLSQSSLENDQRMYRLYYAAECFTPKELALFFNTSTQAISKAKRQVKYLLNGFF